MYCDWIYQSPTLSLCIRVGGWYRLPHGFCPAMYDTNRISEDLSWGRRIMLNTGKEEWHQHALVSENVWMKYISGPALGTVFYFTKRSTVEWKVPETASWLVHKSSARQRRVLYKDTELQKSTADCVLAGAYVFWQAEKYCIKLQKYRKVIEKSTGDSVLAGVWVFCQAKKSTTSRYRSTEKYRWLCPGWCICLLPGAALVQRSPTPSATSLSRITQTIFNLCFEICSFFEYIKSGWKSGTWVFKLRCHFSF